ncbi:hypothetical protein QR685DRAFT_572541 [Neurospora intermedia]|uniref:Uncharacterized protein n=1 Tax=Neurospora intermedia TaxID=5142 RepID=A0ABR3DCG5_NEUIN
MLYCFRPLGMYSVSMDPQVINSIPGQLFTPSLAISGQSALGSYNLPKLRGGRALSAVKNRHVDFFQCARWFRPSRFRRFWRPTFCPDLSMSMSTEFPNIVGFCYTLSTVMPGHSFRLVFLSFPLSPGASNPMSAYPPSREVTVSIPVTEPFTIGDVFTCFGGVRAGRYRAPPLSRILQSAVFSSGHGIQGRALLR